MSDRKSALDLIKNGGLGLFPRGLFASFDGDFLDNMGFGNFRVDVREMKDAYIIDAEMPGIDKNNILIDINDNMLTISTQINEQNDQKDENGQYIRRERRAGSFHRSFPLENIKADSIKADMKNGILTIFCPKKAKTKSNSKRIKIE